jgi:hypothetical protein
MQEISELKPKRLIFFILALLIIGGGGYLLEWSHLFVVKSYNLEVIGPVDPNFNTRSFFQAKLDQKKLSIFTGEQLARISSGGIKEDLTQFPFVRTATFSKSWSSGAVTLKVFLRQPIAVLTNNLNQMESQTVATSTGAESSPSTSSAAKYFDASGYIFNSPMNYGQLPPVLLGGVEALNNSLAREHNLGAVASTVISNLPINFLTHLLGIQIPDLTQISLITSLRKPSLTINLGDSSSLQNKFAVAQQLLNLKENRKIISVDVSDPSAPIVTGSMLAGSGINGGIGSGAVPKLSASSQKDLTALASKAKSAKKKKVLAKNSTKVKQKKKKH